MATLNFSINGTILTTQPSTVEEVFPRHTEHDLPSGTRLVYEPLHPRLLRLTWGVTGAVAAAISELRTKRPSSGVATIAWDDFQSGTQQYTAYIPQIGYSWGPSDHYVERFSIEFVTIATA